MKLNSNKAITFPLIYVVLFIILIISLVTIGIKNKNSQANIKSIGLVNNATATKKIARENNNLVSARSGNTRSENTLDKNQDNKIEDNNQDNTENTSNEGEQKQENIENENNTQEKENIETKTEEIEEQSNSNIEVIEEEHTEETISIKDVKISKNMDLTVRTGLSRKDFIKLISNVRADTSGFFEENAGIIYDLCEQYSINEIFFCGLISAESGWNIAGNHRSTHNYISLMKNGKLIQYSSVEEGLQVAAQKLHNNYLTPGGKFYYGKTLKAVQTKYCPSASWVDLVYGRMKQIV